MANGRGGARANAGRLKSQPWTEALRLVANEEMQDKDGQMRKKLRILAKRTFDMALDGDMQAIKEIGDRVEGRPVQQVQALDQDGDPTTFVVAMPVAPPDADEWQQRHKPNGHTTIQ